MERRTAWCQGARVRMTSGRDREAGVKPPGGRGSHGGPFGGRGRERTTTSKPWPPCGQGCPARRGGAPAVGQMALPCRGCRRRCGCVPCERALEWVQAGTRDGTPQRIGPALVDALGHHVRQEAAEKRLGWEGHGVPTRGLSVVLATADLALRHGEQAVVGEREAGDRPGPGTARLALCRAPSAGRRPPTPWSRPPRVASDRGVPDAPERATVRASALRGHVGPRRWRHAWETSGACPQGSHGHRCPPRVSVRPWTSSSMARRGLGRSPAPHRSTEAAPSRRQTSAPAGLRGLRHAQRSALSALRVAGTMAMVGAVRGGERAVVLGLWGPSRACMIRRDTPRSQR
jgi:hypothetical protein